MSSLSVLQREEKEIKACAVCHTKDKVKLCSGCRNVSYCCVEHQTENWATHETNCRPYKVNGCDLEKMERKNSDILTLPEQAQVSWTFTRNMPANSLIFTDNEAELMMYFPDSLDLSNSVQLPTKLMSRKFPYTRTVGEPNCRVEMTHSITKDTKIGELKGHITVRTIRPVKIGETVLIRMDDDGKTTNPKLTGFIGEKDFLKFMMWFRLEKTLKDLFIPFSFFAGRDINVKII